MRRGFTTEHKDGRHPSQGRLTRSLLTESVKLVTYEQPSAHHLLLNDRMHERVTTVRRGPQP